MHKHHILIVCFIAAISVSCRPAQDHGSSTAAPIEVEAITIATESMPVTSTYVGTIVPAERNDMSFRVGGRLVRLNVVTGDKVRRGTQLAIVDTTNAYNSLLSAQAALKQAEDTYQRLEQVYQNGGVTDAQWQEMIAKLQQARSIEAIAANELQHCRLTAPFDGVVAQTNATVGQTLLPAQTVLTLINTQNIQVHFSVPERDINNISVGDSVSVFVNATSQQLKGNIIEKSLIANGLSRTYQVKALLLHPTNLTADMTCRVTITDNSNDIVIPATCVHTRPEGQAVWVATNGKASRKIISITRFAPNGVVVDNGLTNADTIITSGYQKLYSGAPVKIVKNK